MKKIMFFCFLLSIANIVSSESFILETKLPDDNEDSGAFWNGSHAFILGGSNGKYLDSILLFDPETEAIKMLPETLPLPMDRFGYCWTGTYFYIFGGDWSGEIEDNILRYNPKSGNITTLPETLDKKIFRPAYGSVWNGTHCFLYGGETQNGTRLNEIRTYEPSTGKVKILNESLPSPRVYFWAVYWNKSSIYTFGGTGPTDEIVEHNPKTKDISVVAHLPRPMYGTSAIKTNNSIYIFGGYDHPNAYNYIMKFNPSNNNLTILPEKLVHEVYTPSIIWTGKSIYLFGGTDQNLAGIPDIIEYKLSDRKIPQNTTAVHETTTTLKSEFSINMTMSQSSLKSETENFKSFNIIILLTVILTIIAIVLFFMRKRRAIS